MVRFTALLAFLVLPVMAVADETVEPPNVLAQDLFAQDDQFRLFVLRSLLTKTCCTSRDTLTSVLQGERFDTFMLLDAYEHELADRSFGSFKERFGTWTPFWAYNVGLGVTLNLERRYIAQPAISLRLANLTGEPLVKLTVSDTPFELYVEFHRIPLIEPY